MNSILQFDIHGYWRAGTGRGSGALLDERIHRDSNQLPVLPGRTIKGLLRDAVYRMEQWNPDSVPKGTTVRWFGTRFDMNGNPIDSPPDEKPKPGTLRISNAQLEPKIRDYLIGLHTSESKSNRTYFAELQTGFFNTLYATAINEHGAAKDQALRAMEVTIPLQLYASISIDKPEPEDKKRLDTCLPLIRAVGSSRTRGLGRATVSLYNSGEE